MKKKPVVSDLSGVLFFHRPKQIQNLKQMTDRWLDKPSSYTATSLHSKTQRTNVTPVAELSLRTNSDWTSSPPRQQ